VDQLEMEYMRFTRTGSQEITISAPPRKLNKRGMELVRKHAALSNESALAKEEAFQEKLARKAGQVDMLASQKGSSENSLKTLRAIEDQINQNRLYQHSPPLPRKMRHQQQLQPKTKNTHTVST